MTPQHVFYIPTIFLLGFVFGTLVNEKRQSLNARNSGMRISVGDSQHQTSVKSLLYTFIIFLIVFVITHLFEIPWGPKTVHHLLGGVDLFDKRPVFSVTEIYKRIGSFSAEGLIAYKRFTYTVDLIFPLSFFAFLFTFARFVYQRITVSKFLLTVLMSLPFLWLGSDLLENAITFSILSDFPEHNLLASALGFATATKFGFILLSIFAPSLLLIFARRSSVAVNA
jgi:hypothetical protein